MKKSDGTHIVGIDLGTTYSLVATMDAGSPAIIPNALGELLTPSAVALDGDGCALVGAAARAYAERHPERAALSFKRDMGTPRTRALLGQAFSSVELSAMILRALKADAEAALGGPVSEAVITVPAYFGDAQRTATREAAELAGLRCQRLINEPTAAALAHGFEHRDGVEQVAVLDLGGGTFDVTLLEITDGIIEIRSTAGDIALGGDDFTSALAAVLKARLAEAGKEVPKARVLEATERAKRALSRDEEAQVVLTDAAGGAVFRGPLTRDEAQEAWAPLVARMTTPVERALRDAGWTARDLSRGLLVGGATRMPLVHAFARRMFDQPPVMAVRPDETVALGAAVQAALMVSDESVADLVSTDIAPFTLGIQTTEVVHGHHVPDLYTPILERGTVLPASRAKSFTTLHPNQTAIEIKVFQGEHPVAERNTALGELTIDGLPAGRLNSVMIRFSYDLNGLLEVEATSVQAGHSVRTLIDRSQGKLSDDARQRILARFERLKVDPRELLPNRVAMERGESAYARSLGDDREAIGRALAVFRVALAEGKEVEEARVFLSRVVQALDAPRGP